MHGLSLAERSELRLAITAVASDPSTSRAAAGLLTSAYAKLAREDHLTEDLPDTGMSGKRPADSVTDVLERLFPAIEEELAATARATIALQDRLAQSPRLKNAARRLL